jgi:hypothetical protein
VVDPVAQGVLDQRCKRLDDRRLDRLESVLEVHRRERGLEQRREDVAIVDEARELAAAGIRVVARQALAEAQLSRDDRAARTRDDLGAQLRELPLVEVGEAVVERPCDRKLEHRVAEELEPLVGLAAHRRPARMRERPRDPLGREVRDELGEPATGGR